MGVTSVGQMDDAHSQLDESWIVLDGVVVGIKGAIAIINNVDPDDGCDLKDALSKVHQLLMTASVLADTYKSNF